jgi:hypothetical protein
VLFRNGSDTDNKQFTIMGSKKKYYANFCVNNGTMYMQLIWGNNKRKVAKQIKDVALAEVFQGNTGTFSVTDNKASECVIYATIDRNKRVHYSNYYD